VQVHPHPDEDAQCSWKFTFKLLFHNILDEELALMEQQHRLPKQAEMNENAKCSERCFPNENTRRMVSSAFQDLFCLRFAFVGLRKLAETLTMQFRAAPDWRYINLSENVLFIFFE
jgi:hypothetical protein